MSQETISLDQLQALDGIIAAIGAAELVGEEGRRHARQRDIRPSDRMGWTRLAVRGELLSAALLAVICSWRQLDKRIERELQRRDSDRRRAGEAA